MDPVDDTLAERLTKSRSVASLARERRVARKFADAGWRVVHGVYFRDPETSKARELDVLASKAWLKHVTDDHVEHVRINILVECKTLEAFHILLAPPVAWAPPTRPPMFSLGSRIALPKLLEALSDLGFTENGIKSARREMIEATYVEQMDLAPIAFSPDHIATSFKETNTGHEKEIEASVVWRATQALRSAVIAFRNDELSARILELRTLVEVSDLCDEDAGAQARDTLMRSFRRREYYHPVLVTESPLWLTEDAGVKRVGVCRFELRGASHIAEWWVDIVHVDALDDFVSTLSAHYFDGLVRLGAKENQF